MQLRTDNVQKLIGYYMTHQINGWDYTQCVAGVLVDMELAPNLSDNSVAMALGIPIEDAKKLVVPPGMQLRYITSARAVKTLAHLLATGHVEWER